MSVALPSGAGLENIDGEQIKTVSENTCSKTFNLKVSFLVQRFFNIL